jgi:hypothetical protein
MKQSTARAHRTHKTKEDFLRWLEEKKALIQQAADNLNLVVEQEAIMVWADDGGSTNPPVTDDET